MLVDNCCKYLQERLTILEDKLETEQAFCDSYLSTIEEMKTKKLQSQKQISEVIEKIENLYSFEYCNNIEERVGFCIAIEIVTKILNDSFK